MSKTFQAFRTRLQELITSLALGEPPNSGPNKPGAASKELSRTKLLGQLTSVDFCKTMYTLSEEYCRLQTERPKVAAVGRRMRPMIPRYVNGMKRLKACVQQLADFNERYPDLSGLSGPGIRQTIRSAVDLIETAVKQLERQRGILAARVHPKLRGKAEQTEWNLLFKEYDYDLEKLGVKAADQWFWTNVNDAILEFIGENKLANISAMTRFKLIAAISEAAGHGTVPPTTIKQFLVKLRRK
jgi:hypothetical protein